MKDKPIKVFFLETRYKHNCVHHMLNNSDAIVSVETIAGNAAMIKCVWVDKNHIIVNILEKKKTSPWRIKVTG